MPTVSLPQGLESARKRLPELVTGAEREGRTTVITRRGKPAAALVPLSVLDSNRKREAAAARSLLTLAGTGKGLWGRDSRRMLTDLRDEW